MAIELRMPQMGYDMEEGTVVKWLVQEGETVKRNAPVAEIETDKAVVEFETETAVSYTHLTLPTKRIV